jgi:uncharacterized membrane protein YagU involved in acid resistance
MLSDIGVSGGAACDIPRLYKLSKRLRNVPNVSGPRTQNSQPVERAIFRTESKTPTTGHASRCGPSVVVTTTVTMMQSSRSRSPSGNAELGVENENGHEVASARALTCFVVGYSVMHHNGLLGSAELWSGTRVADWIDLATPFAVLLPLLSFLWLQRPGPRLWVVAAIGSVLYVEGHGIHLSANSIGNVAVPDGASKRSVDIVHLWDEVVGHYVWYLGLAIVIAACARSVRGRSLGIPTIALVAGGAASGITWATNGLEGGTAVASLAAGCVATVPALRRSRGLAPALAAGGCVAVVMLVAYAIWHGGFPQPSSL